MEGHASSNIKGIKTDSKIVWGKAQHNNWQKTLSLVMLLHSDFSEFYYSKRCGLVHCAQIKFSKSSPSPGGMINWRGPECVKSERWRDPVLLSQEVRKHISHSCTHSTDSQLVWKGRVPCLVTPVPSLSTAQGADTAPGSTPRGSAFEVNPNLILPSASCPLHSHSVCELGILLSAAETITSAY